MKQVIIIRTDLKMGKGKIAAQSSHASVASMLKARKEDMEEWMEGGMKKVVLKVASEKELLEISKKARKEKLPHELIIDAGLTQIEPGSATALGIGPAEDAKINKLTGKLKLL